MSKNAYEATCKMCDKRLFWSVLYDSWQHTEDRSIHCKGKASVATPDDNDDKWTSNGETES